MGERIRLRKDFDISRLLAGGAGDPEGLKKYGMFVRRQRHRLGDLGGARPAHPGAARGAAQGQGRGLRGRAAAAGVSAAAGVKARAGGMPLLARRCARSPTPRPRGPAARRRPGPAAAPAAPPRRRGCPAPAPRCEQPTPLAVPIRAVPRKRRRNSSSDSPSTSIGSSASRSGRLEQPAPCPPAPCGSTGKLPGTRRSRIPSRPVPGAGSAGTGPCARWSGN